MLLLIGPVGWAVLLFLALFTPDRSERLRVEVPWTADTEARVQGLRRRRRIAYAIAAVAGLAIALSIFLAAGPGAGAAMIMQVVRLSLVLTTVAALAVGLVAERRLGHEAVRVELDASRRWVTLGNVHPGFAQAVRTDQDRRHQHQR